jgi:hypothetical protein
MMTDCPNCKALRLRNIDLECVVLEQKHQIEALRARLFPKESPGLKRVSPEEEGNCYMNGDFEMTHNRPEGDKDGESDK